MAAPLIITVAEKHEPKSGGKQGRIIDTAGGSWQVWGDKLHLFEVGGSYKIEDWKTNMFKGQNFVTVGKFSEVTSDDFMPALPVKGSASQVQSPPPSGREQDRHIFVTALVKSQMENANVLPLLLTVGDITGLINKAFDAFNQSRLGTPQISTGNSEADFDDKIPF